MSCKITSVGIIRKIKRMAADNGITVEIYLDWIDIDGKSVKLLIDAPMQNANVIVHQFVKDLQKSVGRIVCTDVRADMMVDGFKWKVNLYW